MEPNARDPEPTEPVGEPAAPPPPPPNAPFEPRTPAFRRTSRAQRIASVLAGVTMSLLFAVAVGLWFLSHAVHRHGMQSHAASRANAPLQRSGDEVEQLVTDAMYRGRTFAEGQREPELRPIDLRRVVVPDEFEVYRELLQPLVDAAMFPEVLADRLADYGRPIALSAIAMLQELDYHDGRDCQRAVNLQRFLEQVTRVDGMRVETAGYQPTEREVCWLLAVADGWRRVAERFLCDDAAFERLRASRRGMR